MQQVCGAVCTQVVGGGGGAPPPGLYGGRIWRGGAPDWGPLMSHVKYKCPCCMLWWLIFLYVPCRLKKMSMSHVTLYFKVMLLSLRLVLPCQI